MLFISAIVIITGWVISLCFHEFAHALVAYWGGDTTVKEKGYLSLNPLKYTNIDITLVLPLVWLLLGGFALPGGAVYINTNLIRNRYWESLTSFAGPFANLLIAFFLSLIFADNFANGNENNWFLSSIAFIIALEIFSFTFNLLPIPPLDGYGIIRPWLADNIQQKINQYSRYILLFILGIFFFAPSLISPVWNFVFLFCDYLGVPFVYIRQGFSLLLNPQNQFLFLVLIVAWAWVYKSKNNQLEKGNKFFSSGDYQGAIQSYNDYLKNNSSLEVWYKKGLSLLNLKRYDEAISCFEKTISLNSEFGDAWYFKGTCYYYLSQYQKAIACFAQVINLKQENDYQVYYNSACCYSLEGDLDNAIKFLKESEKINYQKTQEYLQTDSDFDHIRDQQKFIDYLSLR